jgi:ribosome modulation factor
MSFSTARFRTIYMTGWDATLIGKMLNENPYHREDCRRWWTSGFNDCSNGKALPFFYGEWSKTNAAKRMGRVN